MRCKRHNTVCGKIAKELKLEHPEASIQRERTWRVGMENLKPDITTIKNRKLTFVEVTIPYEKYSEVLSRRELVKGLFNNCKCSFLLRRVIYLEKETCVLQLKTKVIGGTSPEESKQLMDLIPTNTHKLAGISDSFVSSHLSFTTTTPNLKRNLKGVALDDVITYYLRYFHLNAILSYILMISSHTIKSKNIVLKKRGREKTVNTVAEYQAACS